MKKEILEEIERKYMEEYKEKNDAERNFFAFTSTNTDISKLKIFVFDIDGIIFNYYLDTGYNFSDPIQCNIDLINKLHNKGHKIILNTARHDKYRTITIKQLKKWAVSYDELHFGKPQGDFYIDDRGISTDNLRNMLSLGEI